MRLFLTQYKIYPARVKSKKMAVILILLLLFIITPLNIIWMKGKKISWLIGWSIKSIWKKKIFNLRWRRQGIINQPFVTLLFAKRFFLYLIKNFTKYFPTFYSIFFLSKWKIQEENKKKVIQKKKLIQINWQ